VTLDDVKAAEVIWGRSVLKTKGNMTRKNGKSMSQSIVKVPTELIKLHKNVELAIDCFFVNKHIFLYIAVNGLRMSLDKWCTGLITRLLEITHGQWLYRNYIVHDLVSGIIATARKEESLVEIERQRELGDAGLLEEDKYLAEVNLEEMSTSSGERHHYWLLAIQTARNHYTLRAQREAQQMAQSDTTGEEGR
jgi:hypothetical protein